MSKVKNQHFVPRFYLKRFSRNQIEKSINIFLPDRSKFVEGGSIADQASRGFYYGKDGVVENNLSALEGKWSSTIKSFSKENFPDSLSERHNNFLEFVCYTDFRNPFRADQIEELSKIQGAGVRALHKVMKEEKVLESEKFIVSAQEQVRQNKVMESLQNAERAVSIISDLKMKLLVNNSPRPFLTSDFPIVQYNQYFEKLSKRHIPFGLGSWGTQIFIPIDSKQVALLYDSERYLVGNHKDDFVLVTNSKDVDQINVLQYQNCLHAVYGNEHYTQEYAEFLNKLSNRFKKKQQINYSIVEDTSKSNNVSMTSFNIRCQLRLPFIALPLSAAKNKLNPNLIYVRPAVENVRLALERQDRAAAMRIKSLFKNLKRIAD